jgi:hypothetical protein
MKRIVTLAAAALVIGGLTSLSFANETVDKKNQTKTTETKSTEPIAKTHTTAPAAIETKPPASTPNHLSATETMTNKAADMTKDKAADPVKDKAMDAASSSVKSTVNPTPSKPSVPPTAAAAKVVPSSIPTTANGTAPVAK